MDKRRTVILTLLTLLLAQVLYASAVEFDSLEQRLMERYGSGGDTLKFYSGLNVRPYAYQENGVVSGILADIFAEAMGANGMNYKLAMMNSVDGMAKTPPLVLLEVGAVQRVGFEGDVKRIAVSNSMKLILDEIPELDKGKVVLYDSPKQAVNAVKTQKADQAYLFYPMAEHFVSADFSKRIELKVVPNVEVPLCLYMPAEKSGELMPIIKKSLESVPARTVDALSHRYGWYFFDELKLWEYLWYHPLYIVVTLVIWTGLLFLIGFVFVDNRLKKAEIDRSSREQERLKKSRAEAAAANMAKSRFFANVSHDIRTPMNAIVGYVERAENNLDKPDIVQDCIRKCKVLNGFLLQIIDDVLDLSRFDTNKVVLNETENDIVSLSENLCTTLDRLLLDKNIKLEWDFSGVKKRVVVLDAKRVQQMMTNVLSSSIKNTPQGGYVKFTVSQESEDGRGYIRHHFRFVSNGFGISKTDIARILNESTTNNVFLQGKIDGPVLGLSIVKRLVEMMGGQVEISGESSSEVAVTVYMNFLHGSGKLAGQPVLGQEAGRSAEFLKGRRVLLAEDNEFNREITAELLRDIGLVVDCVENGEQAVGSVRQHGARYYDCIFMDIQMPHMDGYEATGVIRGLFPNDYIPIIAISANAFEEDRQRSLAAGMDEHLSKPIAMSKLVEVMLKYVGSGNRL